MIYAMQGYRRTARALTRSEAVARAGAERVFRETAMRANPTGRSSPALDQLDKGDVLIRRASTAARSTVIFSYGCGHSCEESRI